MKIHPTLAPTPVRRAPAAAPASGPAPDRAAAKVELSAEATWLAQVRDAARKDPGVRPELVEATRKAIADGTFERSVDLDKVVENLLGDL